MADNSWTTYPTEGGNAVHEDLEDIVYMVDPTATPYMSKIQVGRAEASLHQWNTRALANPNGENKVAEGADMNSPAHNQAVRLGASTQLMDKEIKVSTSMRASNTTGYEDELAEQLDDKIKELKRDMETRITGHFPGTVGDVNTARETPGLSSWIVTNGSVGATGSLGGFQSPGVITAYSAGTPRALTEELYYGMADKIWTQSDEFDCILVGSFQKRVMSSWASYNVVLANSGTGTASARRMGQDAGSKRLINTITYLEDDFGVHEILMDRFCPQDYLVGFNSEYWCLDYLIPFNEFELAKVGHSDRRGLAAEYCHTSRNEKASGSLLDLTTS